MELNSLPTTNQRNLRRLGRGHGSGRGKTSGRGMKGQKARRKVSLFFEGGALPLVKRLPFLRGRGRNPSLKKSMYSVNVEKLNGLPSKSTVDVDLLVKNKLVPSQAVRAGVKILGQGDLKVALSVKLPVSNSAKLKIEQAGGTIISA